MKLRTLFLVALVAPMGLQAAAVLLPQAPSPPLTGTSLAPPSGNVLSLVTLGVNNTFGTASVAGAYTASAAGSTSVVLNPVVLVAIPPFAPVVVPSLGGVVLTTETQITSTNINFNTHAAITGVIGGILSSTSILNSVVNAGLAPTWQASINLTTLGLVLNPNSLYTLTFNLAQSSLLGNLTATLLPQITASVGDSSKSYDASLLRLTNLVPAPSGSVSLDFKTGVNITGPVIVRFGGSALIGAPGLLGGLLNAPNSTVYSISNININPTVPEPGTWVIPVILSGLMILRRNRRSI